MLQTLDSIISVVFIFLMFSLVVSAAQEVFAACLRLRSRTLKAGLDVILTNLDPKNLVTDFWKHPFIQTVQTSRGTPSYIPSSNVAAALLHIAGGGKPGEAVDMAKLKARIGDLSPNGLGTIISTVIEETGGSPTLAQLQARLEKWVDESMERISSLYQRKTRVWLFVISLIAAGAMNVDLATIWQRVNSDKLLRDSLVAQAAKVEVPKSATKIANPSEKAPEKPGDGAKADEADEATAVADLSEAAKQYRKNLTAFTDLGLPIGWSDSALSLYTGFWVGVLHVLAIIASAFAASLGAPFWFDLLQRFMNIRSAVKPLGATEPENQKVPK